tara:strand:+ start:60 stop:281 length:222 start_codon:yes stop_codon:yes gene_type:complete
MTIANFYSVPSTDKWVSTNCASGKVVIRKVYDPTFQSDTKRVSIDGVKVRNFDCEWDEMIRNLEAMFVWSVKV